MPRGSIRVTSGERTASWSQPQLANRFGRAGPTKLHIMSSGPTTRPRATGCRSTSIMPHGSRFGQSRSPVRSGSPPAPSRSFQPDGTPPGSPDPRRSPSVRQSLTPPLACSRSSLNTKALATYESLLGSPFIARSKAMTEDVDQTKSKTPEFDFFAFPSNALFHERRYGRDRRTPPAGPGSTAGFPPNLERVRPERRARKERRKRIDPTTFDKQYTKDELEFMNAMQRFKEQTGTAFPTYREVISVAVSLGYRISIAKKPSSSRDGSRTTAKSSSQSTEMNPDQTADS